ncbi:MAG: hypothetical protein AAF804_11010 [Bacteroidota bacterium]
MKVYLLPITLLLLLLVGFKPRKAANEKVYLCTCIEIPDLGDSSQVVEKLQYVYLIQTEGKPDCYRSPLHPEYPGYREQWENEAPNHPTVWALNPDAVTEMKAKKARKASAKLKNKNTAIADLEKFPQIAAKYQEYFPGI